MQTLPNIKKDLEFTRELSTLVGVLKNIAVSQFHSLEQKLRSFGGIYSSIDGFFELLANSGVSHPFLRESTGSQALIAVTSDAGLLGGLNMQVIAAARAELATNPGNLIIVGEKGKMYARDMGLSYAAFPGIDDNNRYSQAMQLRDYVMRKMAEEGMPKLKIIYPFPVSITVQRVEMMTILPYAVKKVSGNVPDSIIESPPARIVEYLAYLLLGSRLYDVFGWSRLAEFAARFMHLEDSLQKLKEMDNKLRLQYFRVRHELIDRNMRELFSARLIYAD